MTMPNPLRLPSTSAGADNLIDLLRWRATQQPHQQAYTFLLTEEHREQITYGELEIRARAVAARLQRANATGERVLLLYAPGLDYIVAFWGCLCAGAIAVPVYPPRRNRPSPRLAAIVEDAQAKFVLTDGPTLAEAARLSAHTPALANLHWLATDDLREAEAQVWQALLSAVQVLPFCNTPPARPRPPKGSCCRIPTCSIIQP